MQGASLLSASECCCQSRAGSLSSSGRVSAQTTHAAHASVQVLARAASHARDSEGSTSRVSWRESDNSGKRFKQSIVH
eukprot:6173796-Pleurochrysis_carterae.AAC.1